MSDRDSIERAQRLVARARRRLLVGAGADGLFTGVLFGAVLALLIGAAGLLGWGPATGPWILLFPGIGALFGVVVGIGLAPDDTHAALVLDRAAETGEALVSALTASDAKPAIRALAAAGGLATVGERPLRTLLPWAAPRTAVAAVVALAAAAALAFLPGTGERSDPTGLLPPASVPGARPGSAQPGRTVEGAGGAVPTAARPALAPLPADPGDVSSEAELRALAEDLASRGSQAAEAALAALESGDRDAAVAALREALGIGAGLTVPDGSGTRAASLHGAGVAGAWSSSRWPLRYDRAVRRYLAAEDAAGAGHPPPAEENR